MTSSLLLPGCPLRLLHSYCPTATARDAPAPPGRRETAGRWPLPRLFGMPFPLRRRLREVPVCQMRSGRLQPLRVVFPAPEKLLPNQPRPLCSSDPTAGGVCTPAPHPPHRHSPGTPGPEIGLPWHPEVWLSPLPEGPGPLHRPSYSEAAGYPGSARLQTVQVLAPESCGTRRCPRRPYPAD